MNYSSKFKFPSWNTAYRILRCTIKSTQKYHFLQIQKLQKQFNTNHAGTKQAIKINWDSSIRNKMESNRTRIIHIFAKHFQRGKNVLYSYVQKEIDEQRG